MDRIAVSVAERGDQLQERRRALRFCLKNLDPQAEQLVSDRYGSEMSIQKMADKDGQSPGAISSRLVRLRRKLQRCIQKRLSVEAVSS